LFLVKWICIKKCANSLGDTEFENPFYNWGTNDLKSCRITRTSGTNKRAQTLRKFHRRL
jgi:hypothetical protein